MKHIIISNEHAGHGLENARVSQETVAEAFKGLDFEYHVTEGPKEAISFLKKRLAKEKEPVRIYCCGGDGSIHEAVQGIMGFENVELAIYANGTGNDFVKTYSKDRTYEGIVKGKGGEKRFSDFKELINAKAYPIDISKVSGPSLKEDVYSINVINFGFDAIVGARGNYYKENGLPEAAVKKGMDPYDYALKYDAMKHGRFNDIIVYADGEKLNEKQMLLATVAQGQFVGAKFWAAPKSDNTDGLMDVCLLKTMTMLGLGMIIGGYTKGKHLNKKKRKVVYRRAKEVRIAAPEDIDLCVDGEMYSGKDFTITCMPGAIKLVIPE